MLKLLVLDRLAWSQLWCKTVSVPIFYACNLEAHYSVMGDASQFVNNYQMTFIKNKFFSTKKQLRAVSKKGIIDKL